MVHHNMDCETLIVIVFANMLNEMRLGRLSAESIDTFRSLNRPLAFDDDFEATELYLFMFLQRCEYHPNCRTDSRLDRRSKMRTTIECEVWTADPGISELSTEEPSWIQRNVISCWQTAWPLH